MGQFVSTASDDTTNDELIHTLIKRGYIRTMEVERVFRCVDRGFYYTDQDRHNAYRGSAWQSNLIHLSAPSVYATVLECLELHKGLKFLNIGSGVGYFSTMAGLLLGVNGINHGIEIHQQLIDHAYQKMEGFKSKAAAIDHYDFCEPIFIQGNACELLSTSCYDRIYCGAGVPPEESEFMKSLINIGGILVMPLEGYLVKLTRKDEHTWQRVEVLEVTFTDLVVPETCSFNTVKFPPVEPLSLQDLCRSNIRSLLRKNLKQEVPDLKMRTKCQIKSYAGNQLNYEEDALTQFVRVQYGVSDEGLISLRNIINTFAGSENAISDISSESEEEFEEDSDSDSYPDSVDDETVVQSEQASDESAKRKSLEAGSSEQRKTPIDQENPKRMRMETTPQNVESVPSTSSPSGSDLWETISESSESSAVDSESWVSSVDNNVRHIEAADGIMGVVYDSLFNNDSDESDSEHSHAEESLQYHFIVERQENKLSQLLKVKIDLLPVPNVLKVYLNYN